MKSENLLYLSELLAEEDIDTYSLQKEFAMLITHFEETSKMIEKQVKKLDRHDINTIGEYYSAELTIQDIVDLLKNMQSLISNGNSIVDKKNSKNETQDERRQTVCSLFAKYFKEHPETSHKKFFNVSWCHANLGLNSLPLLAEVEKVNSEFDVELKKSKLPSQYYWPSPIINLNHNKYVICNQWNDENITNLLIWFKRNGITS